MLVTAGFTDGKEDVHGGSLGSGARTVDDKWPLL